MVASLKVSLQDVCSFDDLKERMEGYISREGCDEVLLMMYQVCKVSAFVAVLLVPDAICSISSSSNAKIHNL